MTETFKFKQAISYHYDVYKPDNLADDLAKADAFSTLIICQHGYGQNKAMAMRFGKNIRTDWPLIAQQGPHKHHKFKDGKFDTGFSWVSGFDSQEDIENHHSFIIHCVDEALEKALVKEKKVYLFGFSQSVSLLFRFAAKHPSYVAGVIAVAGAAPTDWTEDEDSRLATIPVLYVCPIEDQSYSYERMVHFKSVLNHHTDKLEWLELPGGHRVPSKSYPFIKEWLDKQASKS